MRLLRQYAYAGKCDRRHKEGTYIEAKFDRATQNALYKYCKDNKIPKPVHKKDFHVTIAYSRKPIPDFPVMNLIKRKIVNTSKKKFEAFGPDNACLVVTFASTFLTQRHRMARKMGATFDYPFYKPHVTLTYNLPSNFDISRLPPIDFPFVINRESMSPLKKDWAS